MKKSDIIEILEREIEDLKSDHIPEELEMVYQIDEGGYTDGFEKCTDFSLEMSFEEGELYISILVERNDN